MKKLKKIFIIISLFLISTGTIFASYVDIDSNSIKVYDSFYKSVKKISKADNGLKSLIALRTALETVLNSNKIDSKNVKLFSDLQRLNNEKIFEIEYDLLENSNKNLLNNLSYLKTFKVFVYNNDYIFKENGVWYSYIFTERKSTKDYSNLTRDYLIRSGLREDRTLVFFKDEDKSINFVESYKKVKLISDDVIYGFPNKFELLKTLKGNKEKYSGNDDDKDFLEIEKISLEITKGVYKTEQKIEIIYDYLLKNLEYAKNVSFTNYKLFSGVEAFKGKITVCEGYVELFNLMLGFNNITSNIIIGDVITAEDYPNIGHAWVEVNGYYYDPTFDDPIGNSETKIKEKYLYFKLPKDLFYTDRYDYDSSPENLKTTALEYRKKLVIARLVAMFPKYKDNNYRLLASYKFKDKYNIPLKSNVSIDDLKNIIPYGAINDSNVNINGGKKQLKSIKYITLKTEEDIDTFLEMVDYSIDNYYLFYWIKDGQGQYVLTKKNELELY